MVTVRVLLVLMGCSLMLVVFRLAVVFVTRKAFLLVGGCRRRNRRRFVVAVSSVRKFRLSRVGSRVSRLKNSFGNRLRLKITGVKLVRSWNRFVGRVARKRRVRLTLVRFRSTPISVLKCRKRNGLIRRFGRLLRKLFRLTRKWGWSLTLGNGRTFATSLRLKLFSVVRFRWKGRPLQLNR